MKKMVSGGTLADRVAALTTLLQQDPIHNIMQLESVVSALKKKDRRETITVFGKICLLTQASVVQVDPVIPAVDFLCMFDVCV